MSWDILPKSILQYFLQKLKDKFDLKADKEEVEESDISNTTPFLYRQTPYEADGVFLDKLVGGSVAWNQLVHLSNVVSTKTDGGVTFTNNGDGSITLSGTANETKSVVLTGQLPFIADHKYYLGRSNGTLVIFDSYSADGTTTTETIVKWNRASSNAYIYCDITNGTTYSGKVVPQLVDLTQMFGTAIADYIYSLEQATAGSGIAWLKSYGFFTKDYYPYNTGELISVKTSGKKYVGFNQWDEVAEAGAISNSTGENSDTAQRIRSKNYISVFPSTTYYFQFDSTKYNTGRIACYDENKNYLGQSVGWKTMNASATFNTTENTHYVRFVFVQDNSQYTGGICINISKTEGTPKNGDYVPYEEHTYDISNIDLRGIPKLVNNELVYDGDTYDSSGDVARKYGIVDLGSLNWRYEATQSHPFFYTSDLTKAIKHVWGLPQPLIMCDSYRILNFPTNVTDAEWADASVDASMVYHASSPNYIYVRDDRFTSASVFKSAVNGVYLIYELATPTTETTDPYENPQICDKDGTEEWIDDRTVPIPVGHNSRYADLPAIMDGDYLSYMARNFASEKDVDTKLDTKVDKVTGKGLSTNDYTNEEKTLVATIPNKADADDVAGTQTVSGNPITLTDCAPINAESLVVELEPKQDLHGYDYPWVGGAGKNKFNPTNVIQNVYISNNDGIARTRTNSVAMDYTEVEPGERYKIVTSQPSAKWGAIYDASKNYVSGISANYQDFTIPQNGKYIRFTISYDGNNSDYANNVMLVKYAESSDFAPYENICPITGYTEVGVEDVGDNLYIGSPSFDGFEQLTGNWTLQTEKYNGHDVYKRSDVWGGCYKLINLPVGTYTFSVMAKTNDGGRIYLYPLLQNVTTASVTHAQAYFDTSTSWHRYYYTFNVTVEGAVAFRVERATSGDVYISEYQLEKGSTATTYEPYQSTSATIQFGQTVYGGVVNFKTGVFTGYYIKETKTSVSGSKPNYYCTATQSADTTKQLDIICDKMKTASSVNAYGVYINSNGALMLKTSLYDDATALMNAFGGEFDLCFPLATPFTLQLTPDELKLLKGTNNLSADGVMQIGYQPDNSIGDAVKASEEYTDRALDGIGDIVSKIEDTISYEGTNTSFKAFKYKNGMKLLRINGDGFPKGVQGAVVGINGFLTKDYFPSFGNLNFIQGIGLDGDDNVRKVDITSSGSIGIYGSTSDGIYIDFYYM